MHSVQLRHVLLEILHKSSVQFCIKSWRLSASWEPNQGPPLKPLKYAQQFKGGSQLKSSRFKVSVLKSFRSTETATKTVSWHNKSGENTSSKILRIVKQQNCERIFYSLTARSKTCLVIAIHVHWHTSMKHSDRKTILLSLPKILHGKESIPEDSNK